MKAAVQMVPYDSWTPEEIALGAVESLPWANDKTQDKALKLTRGLIKARELGIPSQVNLYFANLKRLAKKSVSESIRLAIEDTGLVVQKKGGETLTKIEDYAGMMPSDMLDVMALLRDMLPMAQFRVGVPHWRRDPYLMIGIPGGGWYRVGSWDQPDASHVLIDASKVDFRRLLLGD